MPHVCTYSLPPEGWDQGIASADTEANLQQLSVWANLLAQWDEAVPHYVRFVDNGVILAQALFLERWSYDRARRVKTCSRPALTCLDGPVIFRPEQVGEIIPLFLGTAKSLASKCGASTIQIAFSRASRWASDPNMRDRFSARGYDSQYWATYLVDLTPDEDTLFMNLAHAARKCIKRCQREGIAVRTLTTYSEFLTEFLPHYNEFEQESGRLPAHCDPVVVEGWENIYTYFLAEKDGLPIAVLGMFSVNGIATEIMSSISPRALEEKIPAQDLLHWELMLSAKRAGCHTYDLAGFNPKPTTAKEQGIARFKKKWGGRHSEYVIYTKQHRWTRILDRGFGRLRAALKKGMGR